MANQVTNRRILVFHLLIAIIGTTAIAQQLNFGVTPFFQEDIMRSEYVPLLQYLSTAIKQPVGLVVTKNYQDLEKQLVSGGVDIADMDPFAYVEAADAGKAKIVVQALLEGSPTCRGLIIVRRDRGVTSTEQLRGKRFAFVDTKSASGYIYPRALLLQQGISPERDFSQVYYMCKHENVVQAVLEGGVDAGAVYDGAIDDAKAKGIPVNELQVLLRTDLIPHEAIAVRIDLDSNLVEKLRSALLALNEPKIGAEILSHFKNKKFTGFATATNQDFDVVRNTAQVTATPDSQRGIPYNMSWNCTDLPQIRSGGVVTMKLDPSYLDSQWTKLRAICLSYSTLRAQPAEEQSKRNVAWLSVESLNNPEQIESIAKDLRSNFTDIILLGVGGSDLGARMLQWALAHGTMYNNLPSQVRSGPRLFFAGDNGDPDTVNDLLASVNPQNTAVLVVSQSGTTAETIASFLILYEHFSQVLGAEEFNKHFIALTGSSPNNVLRIMHRRTPFRYLIDIPNGVPGRFSVLSPAGMIPAAILGLNIRELLKGATDARVDALTCTELDLSALTVPAMIAISGAFLSRRHDQNMIAMFPFEPRLAFLSRWFRQLWAESIGKHRSADGLPLGSTPLALVGTTDNHSIQQLILDGPHDKFIVLLGVDMHSKSSAVRVPRVDSLASITYLDGLQLGHLLNAQLDATEDVYRAVGIPYTRIGITSLSEYTLGALIMQLEIGTAWAGELLDINPFDQPAVEQIKNAMKGNLHYYRQGSR